MQKTLREFELELEVADLKRKLVELNAKSQLPEYSTAAIFSATEPEEITLSEMPREWRLHPAAMANLAYDPFAGYRVNIWATGQKPDSRLAYGYFIEHHLRDSDLPYILDEMHKKFQYAMVDYIKKAKVPA